MMSHPVFYYFSMAKGQSTRTSCNAFCHAEVQPLYIPTSEACISAHISYAVFCMLTNKGISSSLLPDNIYSITPGGRSIACMWTDTLVRMHSNTFSQNQAM